MVDQFQTTSIDAYRIRFAVDFAQAPRAGQHAIVVGGVIVGLDTSLRIGDLVPYMPELPPPAKQQLKLPAPEVVPVERNAKKPKPKPKPNYRSPIFGDDDIVRVIREAPKPITSRDISDALGIDRSDGKHRVKVTDTINHLIAEAKVVVTDNRKTIRWFVLADGAHGNQDAEIGSDEASSPTPKSSSQ